MKLAILGATGRTGRLLLDLALARGHSVQVLARNPEKVHRKDPQVQIIQGSMADEAAVREVLKGVGAVLSGLGPVKGDGAGVMTQAGQMLTRLMPEVGVRRLVTLTGAGVPHPGDKPNVVDHIFRTLLKVLQGDVLRDSVAAADLIRASNLDWTIVRGPMLTDGPAAPVKVGPVGSIGPRVTRASVATFMLDAAEKGLNVGDAPAVSN